MNESGNLRSELTQWLGNRVLLQVLEMAWVGLWRITAAPRPGAQTLIIVKTKSKKMVIRFLGGAIALIF